MAQQTTVRLIDDLDGDDAAESVEFAIDGKHYEIDLSEKNAKMLREGMTPFINGGRQVKATGQSRRHTVTARNTTKVDREQNQAIRDWAIGKGMKIAERGRIPAEVLDAYHAEH